MEKLEKPINNDFNSIHGILKKLAKSDGFMNLTLSPGKVFSVPNNINHEKFVSDVNAALSDLDFLTDQSAPEIPKELIYEPPLFKIKKMASKIGDDLQKAKTQHNISDKEAIASFIKANLNFSTKFQPTSDDIDPPRTIFDFLEYNAPQLQFPNPENPCNDVLVLFSFLSAKTQIADCKRQIHQFFAALGSNTVKQLIAKVVCPLCAITEITSTTHRSPAQIKFANNSIFDFDQGFDLPISQVFTTTNTCFTYISPGGCNHLAIVPAIYAVHIQPGENNFPIEIGGKGANPPDCINCKQRPGFMAVRDKNHIEVDDDESPSFLFYCLKCFNELDINEEDHLIINLKDSFFSVIE